MAVKAPPPPPVPIYSWTGFYIGGNGGWGSARKCWDDAADGFGVFLGAEGCHRAEGGTAGGQIGYRWQNAGWVFVSKARATGLISRDRASAWLIRPLSTTHMLMPSDC
jgi:outer membrane immunogenic protein